MTSRSNASSCATRADRHVASDAGASGAVERAARCHDVLPSRPRVAPAFEGTHVLHVRHRKRGGRRFDQQLGAAHAARRVSGCAAAGDTTAVSASTTHPSPATSARALAVAPSRQLMSSRMAAQAPSAGPDGDNNLQLYRQKSRVASRADAATRARARAGGLYLHTPAPPYSVQPSGSPVRRGQATLAPNRSLRAGGNAVRRHAAA